MIARLPGPLNKTTSVEKCGEAFVKGIERRKRPINCPGWVGALPLGQAFVTDPHRRAGPSRKFVPDLLPQMDAEVAALGRSMSARTEALEKH